MALIDEIEEQPEVIARVLADGTTEIEAVARLAQGCRHVVIAARGSSDNAARFAQYVWGMLNGLAVTLATPSLFTLYRSPPRLDDALVVGISQSGESPDLVAVLAEARAQGRPTVAITNAPDSPLAAEADTVVELRCGAETAVAATKTYTAQLAVIAAVSAAILGQSALLQPLPELISTSLRRNAETRAAAEAMKGYEHAAVLGRGLNLSTAFEWALKMQELSYVVAQPFSTADFLHGPIAVVDRKYPVLAVVAEGPTRRDVDDALDRARAAGAPTLAITNTGDVTADAVVRFPQVDEWLSPIPAIVIAQLYTYWLTVEQGNDPDQPRRLSKITRTL